VLIRNEVARNGLEIEVEALQLRSSYFALDPPEQSREQAQTSIRMA
jgi:hypothetical protein